MFHLLYFNTNLIYLKMCLVLYLFKIMFYPWSCRFRISVLFKRLLLRIVELVTQKECLLLFSHIGGVVFSSSIVGLELNFSNCYRLFGVELAYSHHLFFRLFFGLLLIQPLLLVINLSQTKMLLYHSFYYEYSFLSILGKQSIHATGCNLLY